MNYYYSIKYDLLASIIVSNDRQKKGKTWKLFSILFLVLISLVLNQSSFAQTTNGINPTASALGFNVFTSGDAIATQTESEGAWAIGGDLTVNGTLEIFGGTSFFNGDPSPAGLIVEGGINWSSGQLKVLQGQYMYLGSHSGSTIHDDGAYNNNTKLTVLNGGYNSAPSISLQDQGIDQNAASIAQGTGIDFTLAFNEFSGISSCLGSQPNNIGGMIIEGSAPNAKLKLTLVQGTNIVNLTLAEFNGFSEINFNNGPGPTASSPLVINILDAVNAPNEMNITSWPNVPGNSLNYAPYILYNFPNVNSTINYTGGAQIYGTVYVPNALFNNNSNFNIDGQVIAQEFIHNSGELHPVIFNTTVDCGGCTKPMDVVTDVIICSGETYTWAADGITYSSDQSGLTVVNDACTADEVLNLTVIPKPDDIITYVTIDQNQSYLWAANGIAYSTDQFGLTVYNDGCTANEVLYLRVRIPCDCGVDDRIGAGSTRVVDDFVLPNGQIEESSDREVEVYGLDFISYPVPSNGVLNIRYAGNSAGSTKIEISTLQGVVIASQTMNRNNEGSHGTVTFNLSEYPSQILFVTVSSESEKVTKKVVLHTN